MKVLSLKSNELGLIGAATLGTVMLSPAMTMYGCFGPAYLEGGRAAPLAFLLAMLATLPTAISYALLSRDYPDAGSAASWIGRAGSRKLAEWAGWMVFLYYFHNFVIQPVTVGVFLNDILSTIGMTATTATYVGGVLACCLVASWIVYRGIKPSSKGALGFLAFETAVVTALCGTIIYSAFKGHTLTNPVESFSLSQSPAGIPGLFRAMIFGMLAFCGFDVISTLSEETHMARKKIPQATFLAIVVFGVFIIVGGWCLTHAATVPELKTYTDTGGMPITAIARKYWGTWALLIPMTGVSAALGIAIATSVGASRVLFSSARAGVAPKKFAQLHEGFQVPWNALTLIFVGGIAASIFTGLLLGAYNSFVWWATTSTYFAMVTYLIVNLANLALFGDRILTSKRAFVLHGVVPVLGLGVDGLILARSFFWELWNQPWATGKSVVVSDVAFTLVALAVTLGFSTARKAYTGPRLNATAALITTPLLKDLPIGTEIDTQEFSQNRRFSDAFDGVVVNNEPRPSKNKEQ